MTVMNRNDARERRHRRVRARVSGTAERPRLAVFRSLSQIYAQVIDDRSGRTLVAASSIDGGAAGGGKGTAGRANKTAVAALVGAKLAEKAKAAGVTEVIFDRGGYRYHGRVKALADAARSNGLRF